MTCERSREHRVFGLANDCGLRNISWFLRLTRLDKILPASHGPQQAFAVQLETLLAEFGRAEEQRLAVQMPHREINNGPPRRVTGSHTTGTRMT